MCSAVDREPLGGVFLGVGVLASRAGEVMLCLAILAKAVSKAGVEFEHNESASAQPLRGVRDG
jgi:hypothetical protein